VNKNLSMQLLHLKCVELLLHTCPNRVFILFSSFLVGPIIPTPTRSKSICFRSRLLAWYTESIGTFYYLDHWNCPYKVKHDDMVPEAYHSTR